MVLAKLFSHAGYSVAVAADGASALEQARIERPDVALVDLLMPVMDGFEFVHRLREEGGVMAQMPVVFITAAYLPAEVSALALSCGVSHIVSRPAPFEELSRVVADALQAGPASDSIAPRAEFRLELLRLLTSKLSQNLRTLLPSFVQLVEKEEEKAATLANDSPGPDSAEAMHKPHTSDAVQTG
ncbi:MAG: hypothetical protein NVSMB9_05390 [Isosphaeraceae bacterium]